ncbi:uncharacterized protein LOC135836767 isoform X2 [Planococcus citri]|uniref:uncharacterized protein LOC135836767 isoform X2 n=1 Tax=Planococcus citri TaxID=170843 RepID=UPI0031F8631B
MANFSIYEELMPKIQALISPPDKNNVGTSREKNTPDIHQFFKRRGKRHNYDHCDACGEKGNVLKCTSCSACVHLLCHDPPISRNREVDLDTHWICNACQYAHKNNQQKPVVKKSVQQRSESRESFGTCVIINHPANNLVKTLTNSNPSASNFTQSSAMEKTLSVLLHDSIVIKNESIDEDNVGSELEESSDEATCIENIPIKIECNDEELEFPLKIEPETDCHDSATGYGAGNVDGLNMDDVWKILDRKSSGVISDSADEPDNKKRPAAKPKRSRKKTKVSAADNVTGIKQIFTDIINDASKGNPKQFALPLEYLANIDMNLIGTEKDSESFPNDLDSRDLLKLPARKCYYCKGTCLAGPMISCDFCPAHFHLNCLNPPLCSIPDVKWMCPLHPHHVLERVMKNPSSVTELMSWWSKFSVPIDDEDVKSNFIEKIKSLDKRQTNRQLIRSSIKIPDIVKYHYKHPPPRIPCIEQVVRSKSASVLNNNLPTSKRATSRCFRTQESVSKTTTSRPELQTSKPADRTQPTATTSQTNNNNQKKYNLRPFKKAKWKIWLEADNELFSRPKKSSDKAKVVETESSQTSCDTAPIEEVTVKSEEICLNDDVPEQLPNPIDPTESNISWKKIENYVIRDINRNFITGGISITTLSEDIRRILMMQKIKQLTEDLPPSFTPNANPYPLFHPLLKDNINDALPDRPKGKVRAVLCPLSHRPLTYMYGQSLSIGLGFSNDVCLRNYGNCNFVSEEHAVIFYDKVTNSYELINYSEYNTTVDGVCYTCDISRNTNEKPIIKITKPDTPIAPKPVTKPQQKKKPTNNSSTVPCNVQSKRIGSTVTAAETRSSYKKLINDIDKLVSKSQQEMAAIADEDLNEISKAINNTPAVIETNEDVSIAKQRIQRVKRPSAKRKEAYEIDDDPKPSKMSRKSKPASKQTIAVNDDATPPNEVQTTSNTESVQVRKLTKPRRRTQASATSRARPRQPENSVKTEQKSNNNVNAHDIGDPSIPQTDCSDDEYLVGDNFLANPNRSQCRCQSNSHKFPNGRDSSWERTATLNHGSHIQFGCIGFIFSIVNYPEPKENRPYTARPPKPKPPPPSVRLPEPEKPLQITHEPENKSKDDLKGKLMSILNLLSSEPAQKTSNRVASRQSSGPSSLSSRSASPILQNGHTGDQTESPKTADFIDGHIEIIG